MLKNEVPFHFIKSTDCKDFGADGAFGGISPSGKIVVSLYSERPAIPKVVTHSINEDSQLGPELEEKREAREGFVRIIQCSAYFDLDAAMAFHNWLGDKIAEAKTLGVPSRGIENKR